MINMELASNDTRPDCKGRFFRVQENNFLASDGSWVVNRRYKPLKRRSCPGCQYCGWMQDDIKEGIPVIDGGRDKDVVQLIVTDQFTDWETGLVDDWKLKFVVVENKNV